MQRLAAFFAPFRTMLGARALGWLLAASVALSLCAAWFSEGYFHPDEHFQILEFAQWRSGATTSADLPWEFGRCARPALQVAAVCQLRSMLSVIGGVDPFTEARILRILSALLGLGASLVVARYALRHVGTGRGGRWLLFLSNFSWFLPFLRCRFSAENVGGAFFALGAITWLVIGGRPPTRASARWAIAAGFLLGLSLVCRVQMAFALGGLVAWNVVLSRPATRTALLGAAGLVAAVAASVLIDRWFYGHWVVTLANYLRVNVLEGAADRFGVSPWWHYFYLYSGILVPPYSLLVLAALLFACVRAWRNPLVWITVAFVAAHCAVPHKEIRFLTPLAYLLPAVFVIGLQQVPLRWRAWCDGRRITQWTVRTYLVVNTVLLVVFSLKPARETIGLYRWLYQHSRTSRLHLATFDGTPYEMASLNVHYYRSARVVIDTLPDVAALRALVDSSRVPVYLFARSLEPPDSASRCGLAFTPVVRTLPPWLLRVNVGHWASRVRAWSIHRCDAIRPAPPTTRSGSPGP
jgi:GPI mannosyltransferase 3